MTRRNRVPEVVSRELPNARKPEKRKRTFLTARDPNRPEVQPIPLSEALISKLPNSELRDTARMAVRGLAATGSTILKTIDLPNRLFGNSRSRFQDIYEKSDKNLAKMKYENPNPSLQVGEAAVHLASAGVFGKALPAVFGANVGAGTYETAKYAGASEGEAFTKGIGHGVVDTAIWTLGQGLASKYLPKAWQWLGRVITGSGRGAASSVTSDAMLNSLGADISAEDMAKRAAHAAWMVPLLGMLKMGGGRREKAMELIRKARPDLAGTKVDKVIETIESEFSDAKSQKVALAWVARKGANLPDDLAQIQQALEVSSKVKGLDPMSRSPFEILSDPAYARYLPKPKPQDVKAFSNMKRYPMGVIGFDVSDDAAGRQATREMINAYMSPSSNPWCLATGKDAKKLGELGPGAESYWRQHSAVPKQIFFQEVDGKLELTAFRATSPGGEGRQEYWDTSDAGYSGIPLKVKVPGDPLGRYQKMVFRPGGYNDALNGTFIADNGQRYSVQMAESLERGTYDYPISEEDKASVLRGLTRLRESREKSDVPGTFEDIAPGKVFKGDPFRDGRSQTWVEVDTRPSDLSFWDTDDGRSGLYRDYLEGRVTRDEALRRLSEQLDSMDEFGDNRGLEHDIDLIKNVRVEDIEGVSTPEDWGSKGRYVLVEDKIRTTQNGVTKFRTTKYADPTNWDYEPPKPGEQPKPVEIEESELVSPEWMRARGYDPENEADVSRMQRELDIQAWGNGAEAAMAVVPTKRTFIGIREDGSSETVTYGPNGRDIRSIDFTNNGVPYREEFFKSGPEDADPSDIYGTIGVDDLPYASVYGRITVTSSGSRLVRNPDSASPEVLNEVKWDEGLGGFVRTSGGRRWRLGTGGDIDLSGISLIQDAMRNHRITHAQADEAYRRYTTPGHGRSVFLNPFTGEFSTLPASATGPRLVVEDRQPDGTWAPAVDRSVNAETGDLVELPSIPPAPPVMAAKGGDSSGPSRSSGVPSGHNPALDGHGGPRIVVNPSTFHNRKDSLCVAFDEGFRILMEYMDFECVAEPTDEQRRFFANTAYADDEVQLRRTILARICTLDTSIKDPTDEQLQEAVEFLDAVMESGAPQNEWEQRSVQRLRDVVGAIPPAGKAPPASGMDVEPEGGSGAQVQAAIGGGETVDEEEEKAHEKALAEKEAESTKDQDLNGDGSVIDHSKDEEVAGVGQKDQAGGGGGEPDGGPANPGDEPPQDARNDSNPETRAVYQNEPKDDMDGLTVHIGATVSISDSGGTGGDRRQKREPRRGTIEAGLHADNPSNRLEGGTHTRDGLGGIGDGLRADNPSNRLEGGTHTRDGMAGAINKPITTAAEMGPKVSEEGRIDKPIKKDKTRI